MKKIVLFPILLAGLVLAGCSLQFSQDPLKGQPDPIREGIPPQQKPDKPTPINNGAIVVLGPNNYSFMEERADAIQFRVNLLLPDLEAETFIANQHQFPGSTFDAGTGVFSWTPEKGTVIEGNYREMRLLIQTVATSRADSNLLLLGEKEVNLIVHRKISVPEIRSIEPAAPGVAFREGSNSRLTVVVRDPDGGPDKAPELMLLPPTSTATKSLAHLTNIALVSSDLMTKEWTYRLTVQLSGEEFTSSSDLGGFRVRALNRFNQMSADANFSERVYTRLTNLNISWVDRAEFTPLQENTVHFLVYDDKGEATISVTSERTLPGNASLRCQTARDGVTGCVLRWTPTAADARTTQMFSFAAVGRNQDRRDTETKNRSFSASVFVKALPEPTPTPSPAPQGGQR